MGNTCKPMAVSFQCMTKSTTNKKKYPRYQQFYIYINICQYRNIRVTKANILIQLLITSVLLENNLSSLNLSFHILFKK